MQKNWNEMTDEQKLIFLKDSLGTFATKENLTAVLSQIQELQGAISQLEKRVNALENRPAVGS
jgi:polyhydroxyalkanoate synthesis regulator phasin